MLPAEEFEVKGFPAKWNVVLSFRLLPPKEPFFVLTSSPLAARGLGDRMFARGSTAILLVAILLGGCARERPLEKRVREAAAARPRPIEGRLSASREYAPWPSARLPVEPLVLEGSIEAIQRGGTKPSVEEQAKDLHLRGLLQLFHSQLEAGRSKLERAEKEAPTAAVAGDLAAAYLALAEDRSPWLLVDAVAAADTAVKADPADAGSAFNLALGLERMALAHEATLAWRRYLEIENDAAWRAEAKEHLRRLELPSAADRWVAEKKKALAAARAGDLATSESLAREFPRLYRDWIEKELLPDWSHAFGGPEAPAALTAARTAGTAVASYGENFYRGVVAAIEKNPDLGPIAAGQLAYAEGLAVRQDCDKARPQFERAEEQLSLGRSPLAEAARLEQLICDYRKNASRAVGPLRELEARIASAGYPVLLAKGKTMLGLAAMNGNQLPAAIEEYRQALGLLPPGDSERIRIAGVLDEAIGEAGDHQRAWDYKLQALAGAVAIGNREVRHATMRNMAEELTEDGRSEVARRVIAEMFANALGRPGLEAEVLLSKIALDLREGKSDEAKLSADQATAALERFEQGDDRERLACELEVFKAEITLATDPAGAEEVLEPALARLEQKQYGLLDARARMDLGRARQAVGDLDGAKQSFDQVLDLFEDVRRNSTDDRGRVKYFAGAQDGFDAMIELEAIDRGDAGAAFLYVDKMRARGLRDHSANRRYDQKEVPLPRPPGSHPGKRGGTRVRGAERKPRGIPPDSR